MIISRTPLRMSFAGGGSDLDEYYLTYGNAEYADFVPSGVYQEDYEDMGEVSTRPRLTKEQVEVLEAQFQANHKPNSVIKRQLAMQTQLSLPRVAVRFLIPSTSYFQY